VRLAVEFQDTLRVEIDWNPQTARTYESRGVPTLLLFRRGRVVARRHGSQPKADLSPWLEAELAG
jgi:thioredoxin 1